MPELAKDFHSFLREQKENEKHVPADQYTAPKPEDKSTGTPASQYVAPDTPVPEKQKKRTPASQYVAPDTPVPEKQKKRTVSKTDDGMKIVVTAIEPFNAKAGTGKFRVKSKSKDQYNSQQVVNMLKKDPNFMQYKKALDDSDNFFFSFKQRVDKNNKQVAIFTVVPKEKGGVKYYREDTPNFVEETRLDKWKVPKDKLKTSAEKAVGTEEPTATEAPKDELASNDAIFDDPSSEESVESTVKKTMKDGLSLPIDSTSDKREVEYVQRLIHSAGGKLPKYGVDGKFGKETIAAMNSVGIPGDTITVDNIDTLKQAAKSKGVTPENLPKADEINRSLQAKGSKIEPDSAIIEVNGRKIKLTV